MAGALEGDVFIGRKAQEARGLLKIKYPMEHGIVTDWDDMERIWSWVYAEELGTLSEEVRRVHSLFLPAAHGVNLRPAPRIANGGPAKSSPQSRRRRADLLRYVQRPRSVYLRPSCIVTVSVARPSVRTRAERPNLDA